MAKEVFGEFSAYTTPGGVRFMKNNKLASENSLPPEVVSFLRNKLEGSERGEVQSQPEPAPAPQFPRPTEEQLAAMRAESEAKLAGAPGEELKTLEEPITAEDFEVPAPENVNQADTEPSAEQMHEVSELLNRDLPRGIEDLPPAKPQELPAVDPNFLESVSIHTAPLEDIAQALYERFGVYTVYLRSLPQPDEINPLTGVAFTKYHLGIAYQAAIYAQNQGLLNLPADRGRKAMDEGRAASQNFSPDPVPATVGENRQANTFAYRTSVDASASVAQTRIVHRTDPDGVVRAYQEEIPQEELARNNGAGQRYDRDEDEQLVEPPIFGTKPIIRPNW